MRIMTIVLSEQVSNFLALAPVSKLELANSGVLK